MGLSTHILDTSRGLPVAGVRLSLLTLDGEWNTVGTGVTDDDGRCRTLLRDKPLEARTYRLKFETAPYFTAMATVSLYPYVEIFFTVTDPAQHHHIPLLLTANGYTTYRGS